jgi:hypothetical protein
VAITTEEVHKGDMVWMQHIKDLLKMELPSLAKVVMELTMDMAGIFLNNKDHLKDFQI